VAILLADPHVRKMRKRNYNKKLSQRSVLGSKVNLLSKENQRHGPKKDLFI